MTATANAASPPSIAEQAINLGRRARLASKVLMQAPDAQKSRALRCMAEQIQARRKALKAANARDLEAARANQLTPALMDRLTLSDKALDTMIAGLQQIAAMADPVGSQSPSVLRPNGMRVGQMRVPLGVIGIIYESRPNVTIDAAALCLKSGNAAILRGGSEAFHSNQALEQVLHAGLEAARLPLHSVQVVNTTDRAMVGELITLTDYVDVIIPRGGKNLIARLAQEARVPLLKHLDGNCHVYVDAHADLTKAATIAFNAKTYRYGVCGAMETLLVHQNVAAEFLPPMAQRFLAHGVELRGCVRACAFSAQMSPASDEDWASEYLAAILAVKVVDNLDQAIAHVNRWGSGHTDAIVTESLAQAARFQREVDSSSVYVNLPTCFADGFEYGLGAEIGISTNRLHARGPVGLEGLTTYKWVLTGDGQIRE